MDQKFVDAITNVRLVSGTIRIDLMNITGQTDDNKLQFAKTGELIFLNKPLARHWPPCRKLTLKLKSVPQVLRRKNNLAQSAPLESDQAKVSIITLLHDRRRFIPLLKACVAAQLILRKILSGSSSTMVRMISARHSMDRTSSTSG